MKKKVLIFLEARPQNGGSFTYNHFILAACEALADFDFIVFAYSQEYLKYNKSNVRVILVNESLAETYFIWLLKKIGIRPSLYRFYFKYFSRNCRLINKIKADVVFFPEQNDKSYVYPVQSKIITTVHDLMHMVYPHVPEVKGEIRNYHYSQIISYSDLLLVDSAVGKKQLREFAKRELDNVMVFPFVFWDINNGITCEKFEFELPKKYLFYPAQFWEHKNHEILLDAIFILKEIVCDIHLVLVGSPKNNYEKVIKKVRLLQLEKYITILGFVSQNDIKYLYKNAYACVYPSIFGPTNIPPLESIFYNCPILIGDIFGNKEQLGENAIYFNPFSAQSIANKICELWVDEMLHKEVIKKVSSIDKSAIKDSYFTKFREILRSV